jgi:hypothetical protein
MWSPRFLFTFSGLTHSQTTSVKTRECGDSSPTPLSIRGDRAYKDTMSALSSGRTYLNTLPYATILYVYIYIYIYKSVGCGSQLPFEVKKTSHFRGFNLSRRKSLITSQLGRVPYGSSHILYSFRSDIPAKSFP